MPDLLLQHRGDGLHVHLVVVLRTSAYIHCTILMHGLCIVLEIIDLIRSPMVGGRVQQSYCSELTTESVLYGIDAHIFS